MNVTLTLLVLFGAAVWRLAHLTANEDGPFYAIKKMRSKIARLEVKSRRKNGFISRFHLYELVSCEYCNSVWFGGFFALVYRISPDVAVTLAFPLALSTIAIIIKKVHFVLAGIDTYFDLLNHPKIEVKKPQAITADWDGLYAKQILEKERSNVNV